MLCLRGFELYSRWVPLCLVRGQKLYFRSQQKLRFLDISNALLVTADHLKTNDLKTKTSE